MFYILNGQLGNQLFILNYGFMRHGKYARFVGKLDPLLVGVHKKMFQHKVINIDKRITSVFLSRYLPRIPFLLDKDKITTLKQSKFKSLVIAGYWQSHEYLVPEFLEQVKQSLSLSYVPNHDACLVDEKTSSECGIHMRFGDFLGTTHDVVTEEYFFNAVDHVGRLGITHFKVFTNDRDLAARFTSDLNINFPNFTFCISQSSDHLEDFVKMSQCKHLIGSNSSYFWWAAALRNVVGLTIVPSIWAKNGNYSPSIYSLAWVKL